MPNNSLAGFVWTVYDDMDAIVDMRGALFLPPEGATDDDPRASLAQFASWLADAWPAVLGTRDDVVRAVMALPETQVAAAGLAGNELETKLLIWRRARRILEEVLREEGAGFGEIAPAGQPPAGLAPEPRLPRLRRLRQLMKPSQVCRWTSRTLGHAGTALGSLIKLVNLGERLKELKETVEKVTGELAKDLDEQPPHL